MNTVEPIRDLEKIKHIKKNLKAQKSPRDYLLFIMGINLALRIGDLLTLRVRDVLNEKNEMKEYIYLREQKTGREKKLNLNEGIKDALKHYFFKIQTTNPDQLLFIAYRSGKPLTRIRAWQLVRSWCEKVGLSGERFGTHTLRKTWGYQARQKGISIELICEKLGHRSPAVTRRYIGITQEEVSEVEKRICL